MCAVQVITYVSEQLFLQHAGYVECSAAMHITGTVWHLDFCDSSCWNTSLHQQLRSCAFPSNAQRSIWCSVAVLCPGKTAICAWTDSYSSIPRFEHLNSGNLTIHPVANTSECVMIIGICAYSSFRRHAIPAFPDGCCPVLDHIQPASMPYHAGYFHKAHPVKMELTENPYPDNPYFLQSSCTTALPCFFGVYLAPGQTSVQ